MLTRKKILIYIFCRFTQCPHRFLPNTVGFGRRIGSDHFFSLANTVIGSAQINTAALLLAHSFTPLVAAHCSWNTRDRGEVPKTRSSHLCVTFFSFGRLCSNLDEAVAGINFIFHGRVSVTLLHSPHLFPSLIWDLWVEVHNESVGLCDVFTLRHSDTFFFFFFFFLILPFDATTVNFKWRLSAPIQGD